MCVVLIVAAPFKYKELECNNNITNRYTQNEAQKEPSNILDLGLTNIFINQLLTGQKNIYFSWINLKINKNYSIRKFLQTIIFQLINIYTHDQNKRYTSKHEIYNKAK